MPDEDKTSKSFAILDFIFNFIQNKTRWQKKNVMDNMKLSIYKKHELRHIGWEIVISLRWFFSNIFLKMLPFIGKDKSCALVPSVYVYILEYAEEVGCNLTYRTIF